MKYKQYNIIPRGETRYSDFSVDVDDPAGHRVGSVGRVAEAIDLIDELTRHISFKLC